MNYIYHYIIPERANAKRAGHYLLVQPAPEHHNLPTFEADDLTSAISALKAKPYTHQAPVAPLKTLTKRELVDKLIEAGIAEQFNKLLGTLPLTEKLRWEASPTISPNYPYISQNKNAICSYLGIDLEAFDDLFR